MISSPTIFLLFSALNVIALLILTYNYYTLGPGPQKPIITQKTPPPLQNIVLSEAEKRSIIQENKFHNPDLAYQVLTQLDTFEEVPLPFYLKREGVGKPKFDSYYMNLKNEDDYCAKHRQVIVKNPSMIFHQINYIVQAAKNTLLGKVLASVGKEMHPDSAWNRKTKGNAEEARFPIRTATNLFFTGNSMYEYKSLGKHFSCLSQESNHIPGHSVLNRKDGVAISISEYTKKFVGRSECFQSEKFFPKTWILPNKEECEEFFRLFNSKEYQKEKKERRIVYIRKIGSGSHRGEGVQPVEEKEEAALRKTYENGKKCGEVTKNYLMQHYIHNPLLLEGRKFDFRMYMLIASSNPLIVYYHDGFLRVSIPKYDINSNDKNVLLTNTALADTIFKNASKGILYNGMGEEELRASQMWNFTKLSNYLYEIGKVKDPNWLDNYLRPMFKKAMIHLLRATSHNFFSASSIYELYGVDFLMDDNLDILFLEANSGPQFTASTEEKLHFATKMLKDHLEVVFGLLRSRMRRAIRYVNQLIIENKAVVNRNGQVEIEDLPQKIKEFKELTKNKFEPEFVPSEKNGFSKIIDENYKDVRRYNNLIEEKCIF